MPKIDGVNLRKAQPQEARIHTYHEHHLVLVRHSDRCLLVPHRLQCFELNAAFELLTAISSNSNGHKWITFACGRW